MRQLHVHIRRIVIDSGIRDVDPRTFSASLHDALAQRLADGGSTTADRGEDMQSPAQAIAGAVASRVAQVPHAGGGGGA